MLTEKQVEALLEKAVNEINKIAATVPEGQKANEEQQGMIFFHVGAISAMACICECEEALRPLVMAFKMAGIADAIKQSGI